MENTVTERPLLDAHIEALTAVQQFLADHPEIPPVDYIGIAGEPQVWLHASDYDDVPAVLARCARALADGAPVGAVRKEMGENVKVTRQFGAGVALAVYAYRESVCEAKVVRTEIVEVADPDAPKVTVERDVIEWECKPLLALGHHTGEHDAEMTQQAAAEAVTA